MKKLFVITLVLMAIACHKEDNYWGCTDEVRISYSDGRRDTTFRHLYIAHDVSDRAEAGFTYSTTFDIGNGVIRTTTTHTSCVKNPGRVGH